MRCDTQLNLRVRYHNRKVRGTLLSPTTGTTCCAVRSLLCLCAQPGTTACALQRFGVCIAALTQRNTRGNCTWPGTALVRRKPHVLQTRTCVTANTLAMTTWAEQATRCTQLAYPAAVGTTPNHAVAGVAPHWNDALCTQ